MRKLRRETSFFLSPLLGSSLGRCLLCSFFLLLFESTFIIFVHEADGLNIIAVSYVVELHDVSRQDQLAFLAQVQNRVVCEEVRNNLVTGSQDNFADNFASLSRIGILIGVEEREEVHLPGDEATLLHDFLLVVEFNTVVFFATMHSKLIFCRESLSALRASHLEGRLEFHVLVLVDLHLPGMILRKLLLTLLMLSRLPMLLEELLALECE